MTRQRWYLMTSGEAEELARRLCAPIVWCADERYGYGRPLGPDETPEEAVDDFEAAGEPVMISRVYGEWPS